MGSGMLEFDRLTDRGKLRRLRGLAYHALGAYGLADAHLTPLRYAPWSSTFRVDVAAPFRRYVLRIHAPDAADAAEARSEMLWLAALRRDTDLGVPAPIAAPGGALVVTAEADGVPGPRHCVLVHWLEGRFLSPNTNIRAFHQVGQYMAHLHRHAERFAPPPGFTREQLDPADALQEWPAALREGILSPAAAAIVAAAAERLRDEARALTPTAATFGLIHADLHPANLLVHRGAVRAIDFGDCAFGYFAFDLAALLVALAESGWPDLAEKRAAFFAGYGSVRSLPPEEVAQIGLCMAWRRVQDLGWAVAIPDDPAVRDWVSASLPNMVSALRRYADGDDATDGLV